MSGWRTGAPPSPPSPPADPKERREAAAELAAVLAHETVMPLIVEEGRKFDPDRHAGVVTMMAIHIGVHLLGSALLIVMEHAPSEYPNWRDFVEDAVSTLLKDADKGLR